MNFPDFPPRSRASAFSLVELLLSMTVLTGILLMFVGLLDQTQKTWEFSRTQISQFREARVAFDIITKNLSQATLNDYFEQVDQNGKRASDFDDPKDFFPVRFEIQSELHFRVMDANTLNVAGISPVGPGHAIFFQAPLGSTADQRYSSLTNLLNGRGYFVANVSDQNYRPSFLSRFGVPTKTRYRLMEFVPPTEENQVYAAAFEAGAGEGPAAYSKWITVPLQAPGNSGTIRPLAENIVALVISPREAVAESGMSDVALQNANRLATQRYAPNYVFDSAAPDNPELRHSLPPLAQVTMVAVDEVSAMRLEEVYGTNFMTRFIQPTSWMRSADAFQRDLDRLVKAFEDETAKPDGVKINFKVFTSTVKVNGAKWSVTPLAATP